MCVWSEELMLGCFEVGAQCSRRGHEVTKDDRAMQLKAASGSSQEMMEGYNRGNSVIQSALVQIYTEDYKSLRALSYSW